MPVHLVAVYLLLHLSSRCLLRFEYQHPHPILCTALGTDKKWPWSHFHISYQRSKIRRQNMDQILVCKKIEFKNRSFQKMSITINVPLKWYSCMKKKFWIIFDVENWLWKSKIGTFRQLISEFWYEIDLRVILYQWPNLGLRLDVEWSS